MAIFFPGGADPPSINWILLPVDIAPTLSISLTEEEGDLRSHKVLILDKGSLALLRCCPTRTALDIFDLR